MATPAPASLSDVQRILIPVAVGFALGIAAEPLKLWITDRYKRRRLRTLCYQDVLRIYSALKTCLKAYREYPDTARAGFSITGKEFLMTMVTTLNVRRLEYAVNQETRLLADTDIYPVAVRLLYQVSKIDTEQITPEKAAEFSQLIISHVDSQVNSGFIDGRFLTLLAYRKDWESKNRTRYRADELLGLEFGYRDERPIAAQGCGHPIVARIKRRLRHIRNSYRYYSRL